MAFKIKYEAFCIKGPVRKLNEDNILIDDMYLPVLHGDEKNMSGVLDPSDEAWMAVFDGVGGAKKGEVASHLSAQSFAKAIKETKDPMAITSIMNEAVCDYSERSKIRSMGSTVAAIGFMKDSIIGFNVGDSRCYRVYRGMIQRLSTDHTIMGAGGRKRLLTQHIGIKKKEFIVRPDVFTGEYCPGDIYAICSDGITDVMMDRKLRDILSLSTLSLREKLENIRELIEKRGMPDNATLILLEVMDCN